MIKSAAERTTRRKPSDNFSKGGAEIRAVFTLLLRPHRVVVQIWFRRCDIKLELYSMKEIVLAACKPQRSSKGR